MRILLTGIPSYLQRTVASVSGTEVRHRPYFDDIRTKAELIAQVGKIANTGNYLIGEGAAYSLKAHDVTYVPFWHLARSCGSEDVYERLNQEFDICVFASANLLRPGYSADLEAEVFEKLNMPVVVMGIGIQRKEGLKENLPAGTLKFLDVLRRKESFFLTRGYFTAEFLREQGMKFVKPTGCPSLYFNPAGMQRSLAALANPDRPTRRRSPSAGYLGSVADTIVDAHALLKPTSVASYVVQDELIAYNLSLSADDHAPVYDKASGRITGATSYKHSEKWQRDHELYGLLRHEPVAELDRLPRTLLRPQVPWLHHRHAGRRAGTDDRDTTACGKSWNLSASLHRGATWNHEADKKAYLANFLPRSTHRPSRPVLGLRSRFPRRRRQSASSFRVRRTRPGSFSWHRCRRSSALPKRRSLMP